TISSSLNAVGATLFEDFVRPCLKNKNISDKFANNIIKVVVVVIGAICVTLVLIVDKLGSVVQLVNSMAGVTLGATLGLFSLGMFIPRANSKGALFGCFCSLIIMGWIVFGTQKEIAERSIQQPLLSSRTDGCIANTTIPQRTSQSTEDVFIIYRLSFLYYVLCGTVVIMVLGTIGSYLTEPPNKKETNPVLFVPMSVIMNSTEAEFDEKKLFFGWLDFTLFGLMLSVSTLIGIYFGFWGKKEDSPKEYLHGGKQMSTLPVAISLVSCFLSGVTSLGAPTEIYIYGTLYMLICFSCFVYRSR
ncbi:hypothetical protein L9F63_007577, partial [Diploptera punctata]